VVLLISFIYVYNVQNYDWKPEGKIPLKTGVDARIILKMYLRKIGCRLVSWGVVFWDVALCSQVVVDRCFRSAYCLHRQMSHDFIRFRIGTRSCEHSIEPSCS
jgi:hypothetical protein